MHKKIKSILKKVGLHIEKEPDTLFDIVCGMEFPAVNAKYHSVYKDEAYYFCSESCKTHFDNDPEKYVGA